MGGLYALARLGRAGLGNGLFPWARAELFARDFGAQMLAPHWWSLRLGPYLRREPEKRRYARLFYSSHHKRGMARALTLLLGHRVSESQADQACGREWTRRDCVVEFRGVGDFFTPLAGEHQFIRDRLWEMTAPPLRPTEEQYGRFMAMHVRRGDITRQGFTPDQLRGVTQFTPNSWFVAMAAAARRDGSLRELPIVVFTDGAGDELGELLELDDFRLHPPRTAISDLWTMTRAKVLFASGFSTYSMWASFLGGMPTIYAPGKIQQRVQLGRPDAVELELAEGADIPAQVAAKMLQKMAGAMSNRIRQDADEALP